MNAMSRIVVALLILSVGAVTLAAARVAMLLSVAIYPFAFVRNRGNILLEALLRERDRLS